MTPDSLFGNFDGFGRSIEDLARIYAHRARSAEGDSNSNTAHDAPKGTSNGDMANPNAS